LNRAILITGASSGIGFATALAAARAGIRVYAGARNARDAERLRAYEGVLPVEIDVTEPRTMLAAAHRLREDGAALMGLVCNAGIAIGGPTESVPLHEWRRVFDVNCVGAVATVQAVLPLLREQPSRIVLVGSVSGRVAFPYMAPYAASKFALRAIADALRVELAPSNILVTLIEPGSVKTPIWAKGRAMSEEMHARLTPEMPRYYADAVDTLVNGIEGEERSGMPAEDVATAILQALTQPRPPAHRMLGASARFASFIGLLPAALRDRVLRAVMRVP
jgi:NAD(P)-dependent dehydrogenase (short-subunit alcohol dehydrogenase family)